MFTFNVFSENYVDRYNEQEVRGKGKYVTTYLREVATFSQLKRQISQILMEQRGSFRLQINLGYFLKNLETGEVSLFYDGYNTSLFDLAQFISTRTDIEHLISQLEQEWENDEKFFLPKSGLIFLRLAYVRINIIHSNVPIRDCSLDFQSIPNYLKRNRYVLTQNALRQSECSNDCVFISIAQYFVKREGYDVAKCRGVLRSKIQELKNKYYTQHPYRANAGGGVEMDEFPDLEKVFSISISIFTHKEPRGKVLQLKSFRTGGIHQPPNGYVTLLLFGNHVFLITNLEACVGVKLCPICKEHPNIDAGKNMYKHVKLCARKERRLQQQQQRTKFQPEHHYPGDEYIRYAPRIPMLDYVEYVLGLTIIPKHIEFISVLDTETLCKPTQTSKPYGGRSTIFGTACLYVLGISQNVTSTLPQTKLFWFADYADSKSYFNDVVQFLISVSSAQFSVLSNRYAFVYNKFESDIRLAEENENRSGARSLRSLRNNFTKFLKQIPCLTYNGSRFDNKILRDELISILTQLYKKQDIRILKKGLRYTVIETPDFRILDQMSYLANSMPYATFLSTILGESEKGIIPYGYITSNEVLKETQLPAYQFWEDRLSGGNLLDKEYTIYRELVDGGVPHNEALKNMGRDAPPLPAHEHLEELKMQWREWGCKTLRDWIGIYRKFKKKFFCTTWDLGHIGCIFFKLQRTLSPS